MQIPSDVIKCVVFFLYRSKIDEKLTLAGTGFLLTLESEIATFNYLVTAKHVIIAINNESIDRKVIIRINDKKGGFQLIDIDSNDWRYHPSDTSVDIAVLGWAPPLELDYLRIPIPMLATEEIIEKNHIGAGDETFTVGLFVGRFGKMQNIPIVRAGNIASMNKEKVETRHFGSMEAYLVEARSIGGLSGSPVFVHLGGIRDGKVASGGIFYLLGLNEGHWKIKSPDIEMAVGIEFKDAFDDSGEINMGIAIVVPAIKILEIINQPNWQKERDAELEKYKRNINQ